MDAQQPLLMQMVMAWSMQTMTVQTRLMARLLAPMDVKLTTQWTIPITTAMMATRTQATATPPHLSMEQTIAVMARPTIQMTQAM
jgi:hypothetical protein